MHERKEHRAPFAVITQARGRRLAKGMRAVGRLTESTDAGGTACAGKKVFARRAPPRRRRPAAPASCAPKRWIPQTEMKRSHHIESPRSDAAEKDSKVGKRLKACLQHDPEFNPPALSADSMWKGKHAVCQVLGMSSNTRAPYTVFNDYCLLNDRPILVSS